MSQEEPDWKARNLPSPRQQLALGFWSDLAISAALGAGAYAIFFWGPGALRHRHPWVGYAAVVILGAGYWFTRRGKNRLD